MAPGFGEIAERLRRSTVQVRANRRSGGSGVIWTGGIIVTNAHVATSANPDVELWDGRRFTGRVIARDPGRDLAAIEISATDLHPTEPADSSSLRPGALVIAIGNPLGFAGALTRGAVHAVGPIPALGRRPWVQAGVQLAPGNSGGPLADAHGRVAGINTMVWRGLGLAIPSNDVAGFLRHGAPSRAELGVTVQPVTWNGGAGLLVTEVRPGSPAEAASLILGDVLLISFDDLAGRLESGRGLLHLQFLRGERTTVRSVAVRLPARVVVAA